MSVRAVSAATIQGLQIFPAGAVDLRRDLHLFLEYVDEKGLLRTKRGNRIPKVAARRLAKILSWDGEAEAVEQDGEGCWSDLISYTALHLGLVFFDTKGSYEGYSSTEPSYSDNDIEIDRAAWQRYLEKSPLEKERALLSALIEHTPNEFFHESTLVPGEVFGVSGSAVGPAGRMDLPKIRRKILDLLGTLEEGVWHTFEDVVDLLGSRYPDLILDRALREPDGRSVQALREWEWEQRRVRWPGGRGKGTRGQDRASTEKPQLVVEDLYWNFKERDPKKSVWDTDGQCQLTMKTPRVFHRVEGRYLEFFLRDIPYDLGFVDLAYRPDSDPHGREVTPPYERLVAFRLTERFASFMKAAPDFGHVKMTVLPTFEILLESTSYPDATLQKLAPLTRLVSEDGPIHKLKLDRLKVTQAVAENEKVQPAAIVEKLAGRPLPQNVLFDLKSWASRGDRLVLYEDLALLEMRGNAKERAAALKTAGHDVVDTPLEGLALVKRPKQVFDRLESKHLVPLRIRHREKGFATVPEPLRSVLDEPKGAKRKKTSKSSPAAPAVTKAHLTKEDLVGYRSTSPALLEALFEALPPGKGTCILTDGELLVMSASRLPALRKALRALSGRFEITTGDSPS